MGIRFAYKLFTKRKDKTLGPLFINRKQRVPIGKWMHAEDHPTKGYKHRPGWHTLKEKKAPHLKQGGNRVWCKVMIADYKKCKRPLSQGGIWFLANRMIVLKEIS